MNHVNNTVRSIAAVIAAAVTLGLLSTVVSISEPQGSMLLARAQQRSAVAVAAVPATRTVAMADAAGR